MDRHYEEKLPREALRDKLIGLGERSLRKSYYPELQERLDDLERFKTLLDHSRDVILLADADSGRLLDANDALRRDWGYDLAQLRSLMLPDLFPAETLAQIRSRLAEDTCVVDAGEGILTAVRTRDAGWIPAEITIGRVRCGREGYAVIVARDDSERRRMEQALRLSEELYRGLFDAIPHLIWACRPDGVAELYNHHWFQTLGWGEHEAAGRDWIAAVAPEDEARVRQGWAAALAGGTVFDAELRLNCGRCGDAKRWYMVHVVPLPGGGRILKWIGTAFDIHDRKEAEDAVQAESRRKDEFLAMLSHELRNPLAPIVNAVNILTQIGVQEPAIVRQSCVIKRQVTHMARLIEDLLDVSRITQGQITLRLERLDIRSALGRAMESIAGFAAERALNLTASVPDEPLWVDADPVRLEQIFVNLIHNSCKYTDAGGQIRVTTAVELPATGTCVVRVRDTGVGIAPENLQFIFGIFSQVDRTLDRAAGGLGLGLTLVSRLVQMHNGSVEAVSEGLGKGSEFTVRLPLAVPMPLQSAA